MTLHSAIKTVLIRNRRSMTAKEIADVINKEGYYKRADENPVPSSQIIQRASKYPELFILKKDVISSLDNIERSIDYIPAERNLKGNLNSLTNFTRVNQMSNFEGLLFSIELVIILSILRNSSESIDFSKVILKKAVELNTQGNLKNGASKILAFKDLVYKISNDLLTRINDSVCQKSLSETFSILLDYIQDKIQKSEKFSYETPDYLSELIVRILNPKNAEIFFDPSSGSSKTLLAAFKFNEKTKLIGQEIIENLSELGRIRLILNSCKQFVIHNSDAIHEPLVRSNEVDIAASVPPFGGKIIEDRIVDFERIGADNSSEVVFFELMLSRIKSDTGRMAIIVPDSFLRRNSTRILRKKIIDNDKIEAIVSLPLKTFYPYSAVKANLILINNAKSKDRKSSIIFIDSNYVDEDKKNLDNDIFLKEVLNAYLYPNSGSSKIDFKVVPNQWVIEQNYDLTVHKYLSEGLELLERFGELENMIPLNALISHLKTRKSENSIDKIKTVQIKDLNENDTEFYLGQNKLKYTENIGDNYKVLSKSTLLIAGIGDKLKPTYFEYKGERIAVINNIFTFKVNTNLVNIEYLISQLNSDIIKIQLDLNRPLIGVIPSINQSILLKLLIPLPSLLEQMERLANFKKQKANQSELTQFINEIRLATTNSEIKAEIERFAYKIFTHSEHIEFKTEFDFAKFPFTKKDIDELKIIKQLHGQQNKGYVYLLLLNENNQINGVLTVEENDEIKLEDYYKINAYTNFLINTSNFITKSVATDSLAKFAHTSANFFSSLIGEIGAIVETKNEKLKELIANQFVESENFIERKRNQGNDLSQYLLINKLDKLHKQIASIARFYEITHLNFNEIKKGEFSTFDIVQTVKECFPIAGNVKMVCEEKELNVFANKTSIKQSIVDILMNSTKYSPDEKSTILIESNQTFVTLLISNKAEKILTEETYNKLGSKWLTLPNRSRTSSGLYWAMEAIKNSKGLLTFSEYIKYSTNKIFEVKINLKKQI